MFTLGADPELFLTKKGELFSAVGQIGGDKTNPLPMDGLPKGFAIQEDNVMAEFNIPPATTYREFSNYIMSGLSWINNFVRTKKMGLHGNLCSAAFPLSALDNPQARTFGCSPDFDAYNMGAPFPRIDPQDLIEDTFGWRFAGGHLHLGTGTLNIPPTVLAHFCDLFIALPSLRWDPQGRRRSLYGQGGRFRPTSYGIEYRTLSNQWLWHNEITREVSSHAFQMMSWLFNNEDTAREMYGEIEWGDVRQAIDSEDYEFGAFIRREISARYGVFNQEGE